MPKPSSTPALAKMQPSALGLSDSEDEGSEEEPREEEEAVVEILSSTEAEEEDELDEEGEGGAEGAEEEEAKEDDETVEYASEKEEEDTSGGWEFLYGNPLTCEGVCKHKKSSHWDLRTFPLVPGPRGMARVSLPHGGFAKTTMPNSIFAAPTNAKTKAKGKKVCKRPAAHLQEQEEDEEQQVCKRPAAGLQEQEAQEDDEEDQVNDDDDDEDDAHDDEAGPDWSHLDKNTLSELEGGWQAWREKKERRRQLEKEQRKEEKKQRKQEKQERKQGKKEPRGGLCKKRPASGLVAKEQAKRSRSGRMSAEEVNDVLDCWDEFLLETKNTSQQEEVQDKEEQEEQAKQEEEQEDQAEQEEEQDEEDEEEEEPNPTEGPPVDETPEREEAKPMEPNDATQLVTRINMVVRSKPKNSAYLMGFVRRDLPKVYIATTVAAWCATSKRRRIRHSPGRPRP